MRRFFIYLFAIIGVLGVITNIILSIIGPRYFDDIWKLYNENSVPFIGLFTILGALFTLLIFSETAKATENAAKSLKLTQETLKTTMENNRKDDFIKQFTLLLELHGKFHDTLADHLDINEEIGNDSNCLIQWNMTIEDASSKLYQNHIFSPYMRIVYRILKYIDEDFYFSRDKEVIDIGKEKKRYTSIVRSAIRNDVLFFIAINSLNENFTKYKDLLCKFDFFEHLNCREINKKIQFNMSQYSKSLCDISNVYFLCDTLLNEALEHHLYTPPARNECAKKLKFELPYSFVISIMNNYARKQLKIFLLDINEKIRPLPFAYCINERLNKFIPNENYSYYTYYSEYQNGKFNYKYVISNFKLMNEHSKKLADFLTEIKVGILSRNKFNSTYRNFYFSSSKYEEGEKGYFIDSNEIYDNCIEILKYNDLYKTVCNGDLIKTQVKILLSVLEGTGLIKLGNILIKNENDDVFLVLELN